MPYGLPSYPIVPEEITRKWARVILRWPLRRGRSAAEMRGLNIDKTLKRTTMMMTMMMMMRRAAKSQNFTLETKVLVALEARADREADRSIFPKIRSFEKYSCASIGGPFNKKKNIL